MDISSCPVFIANGSLARFVALTSAFPSLDGAPAGAAVGLQATLTLHDSYLDVSSPGFLLRVEDGCGFVGRDLVSCMDHGNLPDLLDAPLRAYGNLVMVFPSSDCLSGHQGWQVSSDETGYHMRTALLFPEGMVLADTVHEEQIDADDPDWAAGWSIVVANGVSAHDRLAQNTKIETLRARASAWAKAHLYTETGTP